MKVTIPLAASVLSRYSNTTSNSIREASYIKNGYIYDDGVGGKFIKKRIGYEVIADLGNNNLRGITFLPFENFYFVVDTAQKIYRNTVNTATATNLTDEYPYSFAKGTSATDEVLYVRGPIAASNKSDYIIKTADGTVVEITDGDHPVKSGRNDSDRATGVVALDGFVFIPADDGRIYNSDLNTWTAWQTANFISISRDGRLAAIAEHHRHVVAFANTGIDFFYNNGNPVGSPLARRLDIFHSIEVDLVAAGGCPTVCQYGDKVFFVGGEIGASTPEPTSSPAKVRKIYMLEDFQVVPISTPDIEALMLADAAVTANPGIPGIIIMDNKPFLIVSIADSYSVVYDLYEKIWYRWTTRENIKQISYNYFIDSSSDSVFAYYNLDNTSPIGQDNGSNYTFEVVTPLIDQIPNYPEDTTGNRKFCSSLQLSAIRPSSSVNVDVSYSDDNYQNFSTARSLDLKNPRNKLTRLGSFTERAFKITFTGSSLLALKNMTLDVTSENG